MCENKLNFGHGFCSWNILLFHYAGKTFRRAYFQSKSRIKCCQQLLFSACRGTKSSGATSSVFLYYSTYVNQLLRPTAKPITSTHQGLIDVACYYRDSYFTEAKSIFTVGETERNTDADHEVCLFAITQLRSEQTSRIDGSDANQLTSVRVLAKHLRLALKATQRKLEVFRYPTFHCHPSCHHRR